MRGSLIFKNHIVHSQPFCDKKDSEPKGIKRFEKSLTAELSMYTGLKLCLKNFNNTFCLRIYITSLF